MTGYPLKQPHEYIKGEPVRLLTLFHPKTGYVIGKGVKNCPNAVLQPWLQEKIEAILEQSPVKSVCKESKKTRYEKWKKWQEGLKMPFTLPKDLPPLRMLLIMDNLKGHKTPSFVLWLVEHGVMPLYYSTCRKLVKYGREYTKHYKEKSPKWTTSQKCRRNYPMA